MLKMEYKRVVFKGNQTKIGLGGIYQFDRELK